MKLNNINRFKKYIKVMISMPNHNQLLNSINSNNEKKCILIGSPIHGNLGDSLIAIESLNLLKSISDRQVIDVPEYFYEIFCDKMVINPQDDIFVCGGGWMGNLYEDELVIEDILKRYPNNRITILPQTIYFSKNGIYSSKGQLKNIIKNVKKLRICLRDQSSYDFCIKYLGLNEKNCFLLPDIALLKLQKIEEKNNNSKNIIFSIRKDKEKICSEEQLEEIKKHFLKNGYNCVNNSTYINKKVISIKSREKKVEKKIKEFANSELVITDRLHSMIFALIAGKKCIALDNVTHKVSGVYNLWLKNIPGLWLLKDINELTNTFVDKCLNYKYSAMDISYKKYFEILK